MNGQGRTLRVGFLTYGLDRPLSGIGRVTLELGRALQRSDVELVYLTPYRHGPFREESRCKSWYLPGCSRLPGLMVLGGPLIALAARRLQLDIVHDPAGISPFTVARQLGPFGRVVTIHDAIAFRYSDGYPWLNNLLHRRYVPMTLGQVDGVITVSDHAQHELKQFLRLPDRSAYVVRNGVSDRFRPVPPELADAVSTRYGLKRPFILCVGAQQARKNLPRLVDAFARLHAHLPDSGLVIAGPTLWRYEGLREQIAALGLADAVQILGYVPDKDLPALYSAAELFVFPSLYEGFGLPILEAMACGTPVVCSNATSLPEVAGNAALLVDPHDVDGVAEAMRRGMCDSELRATMLRKGLAQTRAFSWEQAAHETIAVYRRVLS